jgi:hypothetical protein
MASESALWSWLKDLLPPGHWSRVESGETSPGIPDVYYRLRHGKVGPQGWIELKQSRYPTAKIPFKRGGLRIDQEFWIEDEISLGGKVWIVAGVRNQVFWIRGELYRSFNQMSLPELVFNSSLTINKPVRNGELAKVRKQILDLLS